jgi:6-pyruvoyl-tetrahydropterin synthase
MLSKGAINNLLRISSTNVLDTNVDCNLQIINLNLQSNQKNHSKDFDLYTCSLGDTLYAYNGFILPIKKDKQTPKSGDIIKITKISTSKLTYNGCKIIIIKKYDIIQNKAEIKNNLINVESYEDIQNKIKEDNRAEKTVNDSFTINNSENTVSNDDIDTNEKILNKKENEKDNKNEIRIINPDEIDMKTIINLSQISTFTKNICLYVKIKRRFPIKKFYNKIIGKECNLLYFDLIDTSGNEMQANIYGDAINKFAPFLEEGNIYYIKGGYAKFNDKRYSNIKADYRLTFDLNTQILQVNKDLDKYFEKIEKINNLTIIKFIDLNNCKQNQIINCLGYILQIFPVLNKSSRIGEVLLRKIILCDSSFYKVQFTLWNKFTELDLKEGNILLLKDIRVGNFNNNICLTTIDSSTININPTSINNDNCKEFNDLKKIIDQGINEEDFKYISDTNDNNISKAKSLGNNKIIYIKDLINNLQNKCNNNFSKNEISELFTIKATVLEFEHSSKNYYYGCPNKTCRKKLIQKDSDYFCPGCETIINDLEYYYILTLKVIDASGEYSLNMFGEQATHLFGMDAKTYSNLIEKNDIEKLKAITNKIEYHCFYFYGKANIVKYGARTKIQLFVYKFEKEDFKKEQKRIINDIQNILNNIKY